MKKIGDVTSTADKNSEWTNGNVAAGIPPTILESGWLNSVQREILNVLLKAGIPQNKEKDDQLADAIVKIISNGKFASQESVDGKLAKDQNGADIENKQKFIENLGLGEAAKSGLVQGTGASTTDVMSQDGTTKAIKAAIDGIVIPEVSDATTKTKGIVRLDAKVTKDSVNVPTSGAVYDAVNGLLKPGFTMLAMLDAADIAPPWYLINGDRYGIDTPQGKVLRAFSADLKARWNIVETSQTITLPTVLQPDGRMPFPRPVNGTSRRTGAVIGDAIRNINGEIGYESQYGLATSDSDVSGAFYRFGPSKKSFMGGGTGQTTNIAFSSDRVVPTASENKPLDVGVTWIVFLGV